jgi:pyruvate/2-oxoglutarate dehydrogenase complex dihydrolipoamide acyltransferase (E2) component
MSIEIKPFPLVRRVVVDSSRIGKKKHSIIALQELDVTRPRQTIKSYKDKTGESLSFTAFIIACLGIAIGDNQIIHARRDFWGRLYLFQDVDCAVMVEIDFQGEKFPLVHVLKDINKRSFKSIHDEIRSVQRDPRVSANFQRNRRLLGAFLLLPWFIRDIFYQIASKSPRFFKEQAGSIVVTAVGMFGSGGGWGIGPGSIYTTGITIGGISEKPGVIDGRIEIRKYLSLTVDFDHDIIDGAPAARFLSQLKALIEDGAGLEDYS